MQNQFQPFDFEPGEFESNSIEAQILAVSKENDIPFLLLMLIYQSIPRDETRTVTARGDLKAQLVWLADGIHGFGINPRQQLDELSIHSFDDLARPIHALAEANIIDCEAGLLDRRPPSAEFDFLLSQFEQPGPVQWNLTSMIALTTCAAIIVAGFMRGGVGGAVSAILGTLMVFVGVKMIREEQEPKNGCIIVLIGVLMGLGIILLICALFLSFLPEL